MDQVLILLLLIVVVWLLAVMIGLPIVAVWQGRRIKRLADRVRELEEAGKQAGRPALVPAVPAPRVEAVAALEPVEAAVILETRPCDITPTAGGVTQAPPASAEGFEAWIGRRVLGWAAVVLLLFAAGFFLKYAFENEWIGEVGRVALGIAAGVALGVTGYRYHRRSWRVIGQMCTAAGIVLLYLATFAAFGYYHLLPQQHAGIFLVVLVAEAAALAALYEAPAIAIMAVIGALLAPVLLRTEHDQYRSLFLYLALVNAGVVGLGMLRVWPAVATLALLGTQGLFWAWYDEHYHPEKLAAAIGFQAALFALYLLYSLATHVLRRRRANVEDLLRTRLNAALFFAAVYVLLDEQWHVWMGSLALGVAIVYTSLAWLVLYRRPEDQRQLLVAVALALGFIATAVPLQAEANWIGLGWAVEGLVLCWFGLRIRAPAMRGLAGALLVLAAGRLLLVDTPAAHPDLFTPLLNRYALPALGVAACLLGAAALAARFRDGLAKLERLVLGAIGLGGIALVWLVLSVETYDYFHAQIRHESELAARYGPAAVTATGQPLGVEASEMMHHLERQVTDGTVRGLGRLRNGGLGRGVCPPQDPDPLGRPGIVRPDVGQGAFGRHGRTAGILPRGRPAGLVCDDGDWGVGLPAMAGRPQDEHYRGDLPMTQLSFPSDFNSRAARGIAIRVAAAIALAVVSYGVAAASTSPAASPGTASPGSPPDTEPLSKWRWLHEVPLPKSIDSPWADFILPASAFGEAREDLGDLRLYDAQGRDRPYALRVREARDERKELSARQFNRQSHADRSTEVTLDLGEQPAEHNEIDVVTKGSDFRRDAVLEGSDNGRDWGKLADGAWLVHYQVNSQTVDIHRLRYAPSRFRYLRVKVMPDRSRADDAPEFASVVVYHTVREPGEYVTRDTQLGPREPVRAPDGPGSAWFIDLGGQNVPCEKLLIDVADAEFARPFVVELLGNEEMRQMVAGGELRRQMTDRRKPLVISLNREVRAQRLRLVVTDHSNPPLMIEQVKYTAAARQVVFAAAKDLAGPLRLYAGNPQAEPPHYDFAATLPAVLEPPPARTMLGDAEANPIFQPEPKPWTERWPWLVYVVLGAASLALLVMLAGLARAAIRRHDAMAPTPGDLGCSLRRHAPFRDAEAQRSSGSLRQDRAKNLPRLERNLEEFAWAAGKIFRQFDADGHAPLGILGVAAEMLGNQLDLRSDLFHDRAHGRADGRPFSHVHGHFHRGIDVLLLPDVADQIATLFRAQRYDRVACPNGGFRPMVDRTDHSVDRGADRQQADLDFHLLDLRLLHLDCRDDRGQLLGVIGRQELGQLVQSLLAGHLRVQRLFITVLGSLRLVQTRLRDLLLSLRLVGHLDVLGQAFHGLVAEIAGVVQFQFGNYLLVEQRLEGLVVNAPPLGLDPIDRHLRLPLQRDEA